MPLGSEQLIIGRGDIELGPALQALVLAAEARAHFVQFPALRLGEEFLVRVLGQALERRVGLVVPIP